MTGLSTGPIDSTDAQERRELEAELAIAEQRRAAAAERAARRAAAKEKVAEAVHEGRCDNGWLGEDEDGRPVPCRVCRPHLAHVACRTCSSSYAVCQAVVADHGVSCCDDCDHTPAGSR